MGAAHARLHVLNDVALEDRQTARGMTDLNASLQKAAIAAKRPPPPMDLTDQTLSAVQKSARLRLMQGRGASSTFLSGG